MLDVFGLFKVDTLYVVIGLLVITISAIVLAIVAICKACAMTKNVVRTVVNALPTVVAKGMREGESISMKGFGSFVPWQQSERLARNPKTGEEVMITPRVSVKFKAGSDLLKELNE